MSRASQESGGPDRNVEAGMDGGFARQLRRICPGLLYRKQTTDAARDTELAERTGGSEMDTTGCVESSLPTL
jgi:hypothetical protein